MYSYPGKLLARMALRDRHPGNSGRILLPATRIRQPLLLQQKAFIEAKNFQANHR